MKRSVRNVLLAVFGIAAAGAAVYLTVIGIREWTVRSQYAEINRDNYLSVNADGVAYLQIEGLNLAYPVVQTANNTDYLQKDYWGNPSEYGTIFCDFRNDVARSPEESLQNLVFYGHSMYTGSMFAPLNEYLINADQPEFLDRCSEILVDVAGELRTYRVFAAYYADSETCSESLRLEFSGEEDLSEWMADRCAESTLPVPELPDGIRQVLTLQTCHYNNQGNRIFVHAYLIK